MTVVSKSNIPPFEYHRLSENLLAGRNPLTTEEVSRLLEEGVTHFLDLREPIEWTPPRLGEEALLHLEREGRVRKHLAIVDGGAPSPDVLTEAVLFLEKTLSLPSQQVYVHCRAGHERTAAVLIAFHARRYGVSYDEALAALRRQRPTLSPLRDQERAVRKWLQANPTPAESYYAYENWRANGHIARIHRAGCSYCRNGKGTQKTKGDDNDKWHSPFATFEQAKTALRSIVPVIYRCKHCCPQTV